MEAKYYPRGTFWATKRRYCCSKLWRQLVDIKPIIQNHIAWRVRSGERIPVFSQPWFPNWQHYRLASKMERELTIASLLQSESRSWNFEGLQQKFGYHEALTIATLDAIKPLPRPAQDTLFTFSKNGEFTIKKAYQLIKGDSANRSEKAFWMGLWERQGLIPKLKIFLWRCLWGAIPVKAVLASRITFIPPTCQLCNREPETVMHALFKCDFARAVWIASPWGLRTEGLQGTFKEIIILMAESLSEGDFCKFVCMTWAIWRTRNDAVFGEKQQNFSSCANYLKGVEETCQLNMLSVVRRPAGTGVHRGDGEGEEVINGLLDQQSSYKCFVDGSWSEGGMAGIGIYLTWEGAVVEWVSKNIQAINPAQAEARAVLEGYKLLQLRTTGKGLVFSDSKEVVHSLAHTPPQIHDWRAYHEIWQAWSIQASSAANLKAIHCSRDEYGIKVAHIFANQGRLYQWDRSGYSDLEFDF